MIARGELAVPALRLPSPVEKGKNVQSLPAPRHRAPVEKVKAVQQMPTLRHPSLVGQGKAVQFSIQDDDVKHANDADDDDAPDDCTTADSDNDAADGTVRDPDKGTHNDERKPSNLRPGVIYTDRTLYPTSYVPKIDQARNDNGPRP
jgi:hypothetical protein